MAKASFTGPFSETDALKLSSFLTPWDVAASITHASIVILFRPSMTQEY